jgi:hypothetical protein
MNWRERLSAPRCECGHLNWPRLARSFARPPAPLTSDSQRDEESGTHDDGRVWHICGTGIAPQKGPLGEGIGFDLQK